MKMYIKPAIISGLPKYMNGVEFTMVSKNIQKRRAAKADKSRGFVSCEASAKIIERDSKRIQRSPGYFTQGTGTGIIQLLFVDHKTYDGHNE